MFRNTFYQWQRGRRGACAGGWEGCAGRVAKVGAKEC